MIETYLLEHLAAFKNCRTLSEAAEQLHLTQPTLTRSMAKLEEQFGVSLFVREKKRLKLNANGEAAAKFAEEILDMHNNMLQQVRALDRLANTVGIGSVAPGPIMELIPIITGAFQHFTVSSQIASESELLLGIKNRSFQMIILNHPLEAPEFYSMKCGSEKLFASLVPSHPLADREAVSFADMDGENFLMASEVGMWDKIVRTNMPHSRFFLQEGVDTLYEVTNSSTLPGFSTDLSLRILGSGGSRIHIPFSDPDSYSEYFCICLASEKDRYKRWYDILERRR
ncbi:LysR family transcriptional regulator [bacterium]|nr:LysR family transcriptional regulator [bacterium]